jgi:hypothetical protein
MPKGVSIVVSILLMYLFQILFFKLTGVAKTSLHLVLIPFLAVIATKIFNEDKKGFKIVLSSVACYMIMCIATWGLDYIR